VIYWDAKETIQIFDQKHNNKIKEARDRDICYFTKKANEPNKGADLKPFHLRKRKAC
jgi:hypothetical protein